MFLAAKNSDEKSTDFHDQWKMPGCDKDIFEALEYTLDGIAPDITSRAKPGMGLELLRLIARKYDPISPHLRQHLTGILYKYANQKCQNFAASVTRLNEIETLISDMAEQTGRRPPQDQVAEIFFACLDQASTDQLKSMCVYVGDKDHPRMVDTENFEDLREYILQRHQRERANVPIASRKMDVSGVAQQEGQYTDPNAGAWNYPDAGLIPSQYHEPSYDAQWQHVGGGDLDAMGKGKGWGKGKGQGRVLDCHTCGGLGHPHRLCPSPWNAKETGGPLCDICKGFGHKRAECPSKGGGKHTPKGDGKGKGKGDGKGKGKGKGYGKQTPGMSQYFQGKGSGRNGMSSVDNGYSPAEWAAWEQEQAQWGAQPAQPAATDLMQTQYPSYFSPIAAPAPYPQPGASGMQTPMLGPWTTGQNNGLQSLAPAGSQTGSVRVLSSVVKKDVNDNNAQRQQQHDNAPSNTLMIPIEQLIVSKKKFQSLPRSAHNTKCQRGPGP